MGLFDADSDQVLGNEGLKNALVRAFFHRQTAILLHNEGPDFVSAAWYKGVTGFDTCQFTQAGSQLLAVIDVGRNLAAPLLTLHRFQSFTAPIFVELSTYPGYIRSMAKGLFKMFHYQFSYIFFAILSGVHLCNTLKNLFVIPQTAFCSLCV